jgi:hypothetical protein
MLSERKGTDDEGQKEQVENFGDGKRENGINAAIFR